MSEELTFASSYTDEAGNTRIHYARCEPCMYGSHSGGWHSWAGPEDRIHALKNGQPDPVDKVCACDCTQRDPDPEPYFDSDYDGVADLPCATCGEPGACGYDSEGRPMIHATWLDEDDDTPTTAGEGERGEGC